MMKNGAIILLSLALCLGLIAAASASEYGVLRPSRVEDKDVRAIRSIHTLKSNAEAQSGQQSTLRSTDVIDTLTWRNESASGLVNIGMHNPGDSVLVWFDPPAPCSLLAIRFKPVDWQGNFLIDVWNARNYDHLIYSTDSTDANGWWGTFEPIDEWHGNYDHSPLGMDALDPDDHFWGPFPYTVTRAHAGKWIEILAAWWIQGNVYLGDDPFYIGGNFFITAGWGFQGQCGWTTPYHSFEFYGAGEGPGPHNGWFLRSYSIWFEAIVKYTENSPPRYENLKIQNWTYGEGPFSITADIYDADAADPAMAGIPSAQLFYDVNGVQDSAAMSGPAQGGRFTGAIPSIAVGDVVTYRVQAIDYAGSQSTSSRFVFGRIVPEQPGAHILIVWDHETDPDLDSFFVDFFSGGRICAFELWNVTDRRGIDASVVNWGWHTIYVSGWGCRNTLPGADYAGNIFAEWLEAGRTWESHNLLYCDQDYFCAQPSYGCEWDEELQEGDFLFDYFDVVRAFSNNHGSDYAGYDSVVVGEGVFAGIRINFLPDAWDPVKPQGNLWPDWLVELGAEGEQIFHYLDSGYGAGVHLDRGRYRTVYLPWQEFFAVDSLPNGDLVPRPGLVAAMERIFQWFGFDCNLSPECSIHPTSLTFPTVVVGWTKDLSFSITNSGGGTLNGSLSESCEGFDLLSGGGSYSLAAGQSREVTVRFAPTSSGTRTCLIETGNDLCDDVTCSGIGREGEMKLSIEDACVNPGETASINLNLDNFGSPGGGEVNISFDKSVFIMRDVAKTNRTRNIDFFFFRSIDTGIHFDIIGIGHYIDPGSGPIATIIVDVAAGAPHGSYEWALSGARLEDGLNDWSVTMRHGVIQIPCNEVEPLQIGVVPGEYALSCNYPNPFNPTTSIQFAVGCGQSTPHVTLKVFNLLGQEVATLVDEAKEPGYYTVSWNASARPTGVYFCRMTAGNFSETRSMVLMK